MYADFSFARMIRHLENGAPLTRPDGVPSEEHMRHVLEAYVASIGRSDTSFADDHFASQRVFADPVGTQPMTLGDGIESAAVVAQLIDMPTELTRAELNGPVSVSLGNQAAVPFKLWLNLDGRDATIDIVDVMTFDGDGRITDVQAYWGVENVTFLN
ncbi:hypothetical protein [Microbacterium sp. NPDC079995]|uniref:hypothetical protein n=1 Tax=unclassified Microbacterium TaxID=2609290 RepID=UPI00344B1308